MVERVSDLMFGEEDVFMSLSDEVKEVVVEKLKAEGAVKVSVLMPVDTLIRKVIWILL